MLARPAANPAHAAAACDPAAQADDKPFHAVLAQELRLASGGRALPAQGIPSAAVKGNASLIPGEDAAQAAASSESTSFPACAGMTPFPPGLAGTSAAASTLHGGLKPGEDATQSTAAGDTPDAAAGAGLIPFSPALSQASVSPPPIAGATPLSTRHAAASTGRAPVALVSRENRPGNDSAAATAESGSPGAPAAAELAVAGRFSAPAESDIRRDTAFDINVLDQHKAAPGTALHAAATAPEQVAPAPIAALETHVGARGWDQGLGDKLVWMASQKQQVAELHLNPPELGPLKITLTLNHDQASAQFVSAHAQVREAIETAMPRLREMLADSGITLGNASVSTDAFREQAQPQHEPRGYAAPAASAADPDAVTHGERLLRRSHGLVDTFA
jgi:flagellar hook-length control protein FliK